MKMLFVSLCGAGLDSPRVELAVWNFVQIDRGMTQNQLSGLEPLAQNAAREPKGVSDLSCPIVTTGWLSEK